MQQGFFIYNTMQTETHEEYLQWRRLCSLAKSRGYRMVRQQEHNRYTNVSQYISDLTEMLQNSRDPVLTERYMVFLSDAISYWRKRADFEPSKATYTRCQ